MFGVERRISKELDVRVDVNRLNSYDSIFKKHEKTLAQIKNETTLVAMTLNSRIWKANRIDAQISAVISELEAEKKKISVMSKTISQVRDIYANAEGKNTSYEQALKKTSSKVGTGKTKSKGTGKKNKVNSYDKERSYLSKFGYLGSVSSFFLPLAVNWVKTGKLDFGVTGGKSLGKFVKSGLSTLKGLYEWQESNNKIEKLKRLGIPGLAEKVNLKRLFGLNDIFEGKASTFSTFSGRFKNNFLKRPGFFEQYTSGGAKAAFAWADLALSGIINGCKNYKKWKSGAVSSERAVASTVLETVIDVGKKWLIGTAVAAGTAAIFGSAPVLVVGVGTAIATAGLDAASKYITKKVYGKEKGFTEAFSDLIIDGYSGIKKTLKNNGLKTVCKTVSSRLIGRRRGFSALGSW